MDEATKAAEAARRDKTLGVECPRCGAEPGVRCVNVDTGLSSNLVHGARVRAWKRAMERESGH